MKEGREVPFWVVAVLLVVVQVGFGGYSVIVKKFAQNAFANPVFFSFVRDAGTFPVLLIAARVVEGPFKWPRGWADLLFFIVCGLTGIFLGQLAYILAIYFASPDVASIYQPAMPVWATLFVIASRTEPFPPLNALRGWCKIGGILLAAVGAVLMALSHRGNTEMEDPLVGNLFALGNTVSFAIYLAVQKRYVFVPTARLKYWRDLPTYVTAWSYGFGAVFMIASGLLGWAFQASFLGFGKGGSCAADLDCNSNTTTVAKWRYYCDTNECRMKTDTLTIPTESIGSLVYAVFVTSALNFGLISFANRHAQTSTITAFWPLQVLVAVVLSFVVFGDTMTPMQYGGAAAIAGGLALVVIANRLEEKLQQAYALLVND